MAITEACGQFVTREVRDVRARPLPRADLCHSMTMHQRSYKHNFLSLTGVCSIRTGFPEGSYRGIVYSNCSCGCLLNRIGGYGTTLSVSLPYSADDDLDPKITIHYSLSNTTPY